ncbi:MAG: amidohydrolase family protein, partial [Acidimicrobiia bacterium]
MSSDLDLVIRHGTVIDGTGRAGFAGDVAIRGDRIVAVGTVDARGTREIDATDRYVTPGFVDLHTHLDAQIGWDPLRTGCVPLARRVMRYVFPEHWSFLWGEVALYCF